MNVFEKYLLYIKLMNSNPETFVRPYSHNRSLKCLDWKYRDEHHLYTVQAYYDNDTKSYWTNIKSNDRSVAMFHNGPAKKLFDMAMAHQKKQGRQKS